MEDEREQEILHNNILKALDEVKKLVTPKKKVKAKPLKQKTFANDSDILKRPPRLGSR